MTVGVRESTVEAAALEWFAEVGWEVRFGPFIAPGEVAAERASYEEVVLTRRLAAAIDRLNPSAPAAAREDALRRVLRLSAATAIGRNRLLHRMLVDGVEVDYAAGEGRVAGERIRLVDFERPAANDWLAVNQFTVVEAGENRRPDVVLFVNGLPLVLLELKNPDDETADIWSAFNQLQTYKTQDPGALRVQRAARRLERRRSAARDRSRRDASGSCAGGRSTARALARRTCQNSRS